jgi:Flp pilus assembly protein TadG
MGKRSSLLTRKNVDCRKVFSKGERGTRAGERSARNAEKGVEVVEFGLLLVVLLSLLFGIIALARAYNIYQSITRAAREGARMAVLPSSVAQGNQYMDPTASATQSSSAIFNRYIAPALVAANLNPNDVIGYSEKVEWLDPGDANQQCGVVVSFQYPYTLFIPFTTENLTTINIPTHVQMRRENQPSGGTCP